MNRQFPQDDTPESLEGTAAHWVLAEMLDNRNCIEGTPAPNRELITGEMLDGAELACDVIRERTKLMAAQHHVEETVSIPVHPQIKDCFGTPDFWAYSMGKAHLEIVDYKFGNGFVDEWFNPQGLLYMLGILESIKAQISNPMLVTVSFTIVQPRCFYRGLPVRTHCYIVKDAAEHLVRLQEAALAAMQPQPMATTNPECDHCPGRHACSALQQASYRDAEISNNRLPVILSPSAAALELRMLKRAWERMGARIDGLEQQTIANIQAGKAVHHYHIEHGKGRAQWTIPSEMVIAIGNALGKDLSKVTAITPSQAKKLIDADVISAYSVINPGSARLIPENNADAAKVFGGEMK